MDGKSKYEFDKVFKDYVEADYGKQVSVNLY